MDGSHHKRAIDVSYKDARSLLSSFIPSVVPRGYMAGNHFTRNPKATAGVAAARRIRASCGETSPH